MEKLINFSYVVLHTCRQFFVILFSRYFQLDGYIFYVCNEMMFKTRKHFQSVILYRISFARICKKFFQKFMEA